MVRAYVVRLFGRRTPHDPATVERGIRHCINNERAGRAAPLRFVINLFGRLRGTGRFVNADGFVTNVGHSQDGWDGDSERRYQYRLVSWDLRGDVGVDPLRLSANSIYTTRRMCLYTR